MAGIINTATLPKLMRPGLHEIAGMSYDAYPEEWREIYSINTSKMGYEEEQMVSLMGYAKAISEGQSIEYDDVKQSYPARYTHGEYGLGFIVTRNEVDDNLYKTAADFRAEGLGRAMNETKNINGASTFNFGFDVAHPIGDGQPFFSASHPTETGSTQSNILAVGGEISELTLEELLLQIYAARDPRGLKAMLKEQALVIPCELQFEATRLLQNPQRPGTAERDINAINIMGKFPKGIIVNHFLTDPDAWFVTTNCPHGMKYFERRVRDFDQDKDFGTSNMFFKMTERYSFGVTDWRGCYASQGA